MHFSKKYQKYAFLGQFRVLGNSVFLFLCMRGHFQGNGVVDGFLESFCKTDVI